MRADLEQRRRGMDADVLAERGLDRRRDRQDEARPVAARGERLATHRMRHRERAADRSQRARQRQLAGVLEVVDAIGRQLPRSDEDADRDRQVERPDSFGRSAGARLTVMRRAGSSKRALRMAARTRSRLSFTSVSARPTMLKCGRPPVRCTSTTTSGASMPASARLRTMASDRATVIATRCSRGKTGRRWIASASNQKRRVSASGGGRARALAFETVDARLEIGDAGLGTRQQLGLQVELLARREVEVLEACCSSARRLLRMSAAGVSSSILPMRACRFSKNAFFSMMRT